MDKLLEVLNGEVACGDVRIPLKTERASWTKRFFHLEASKKLRATDFGVPPLSQDEDQKEDFAFANGDPCGSIEKLVIGSIIRSF